MAEISRNPTRAVAIGDVVIGDGNPIAVQSMTATATSDVDATAAQVNALQEAGADIVRIAVDNRGEAEAVRAIREKTSAVLSVDLQENYRLAEIVAPAVDKIRYNPGHLYHHEKDKPWEEKVRYLAEVAGSHDCAIRVGINCGSVDPAQGERFKPGDALGPMLASAGEHCELLDRIGFERYCVSLKDSDPAKVVEVNRRRAGLNRVFTLWPRPSAILAILHCAPSKSCAAPTSSPARIPASPASCAPPTASRRR